MAAFSFHLPNFDARQASNDARQPNTSDTSTPFNHAPLLSIPDYNSGHATPGSFSSTDAAVGSFEYDLQHNYKLRWKSGDAMLAWMKGEQRDKSIEFLRKGSAICPSSMIAWETTTFYICARQGSGGKSAYRQKRNWKRKISTKRTGCPLPPHCKNLSWHLRSLGVLQGGTLACHGRCKPEVHTSAE
ncbi:hypothetical protein DFH09DRAFT_1095950 [Mycena vulgaris]|nr:hypothetical protein DFH09DRAFT_1095950 [Mycena vulgaris]